MLFVVQYTITDCRRFLGEQQACIPYPDWPNPQVNEFAKLTGTIQYRKYGGINNWIGESHICAAKKAIKIDKWLTFATSKLYYADLLFRRFYFDGTASGKYEIGFRLKVGWLKEVEIEKIIEDILSLNVRISMGNGKEELVPLGKAENALSKNYLITTTRSRSVSEIKEQSIKCHPPVLFLTSAAKEKIKFKFTGTTVPIKTPASNISYFQLKNAQRTIALWHLESMSSDMLSPEDLQQHQKAFRNMRVILVRLVATRKSLQHILKLISREYILPEPFSTDSNRIQAYLISTIKNTIKKEKGFQNEDLTQLLYMAEDAILPGEREALYEKLKLTVNIRPQVFSKLEEFLNPVELTNRKIEIVMEKNEINITGSQNVNVNQGDGNTIQNTNQKYINNADLTAKIEKKLKEIDTYLDSLKEQVNETELEDVVSDREQITTELKREKPRKNRLKGYLDNFLDSTKKIGETAVPIIAIIKDILLMIP